MQSFTRYTGRRKKAGRNVVTITKNGYININSAASKYFKEFDYVDLYSDETSDRVGLKPTNEKKPGTYSLIEQSNYQAYTIGCKGFLKEFGIPFDETKRFSAEWDEENKLLIAELENGEEVR